MKPESDNLIKNLCFEFTLKIMKYCDELNSTRKFQLSKQLFASGTSIGANVWEAQHPESLRDFVHNLKIASKECSESQYWLTLAANSNDYPPVQGLLNDCDQIARILSKILSTSRRKLQN